MSSQTNEKAFETYVQQMLLAKGWQQGSVAEWDKERAFFPDRIRKGIRFPESDNALCRS